MELNTPQELINDIRLGKMVILMDDEDRENEGDIVIAAECVKPEDINFMAKYARGLICLTLTEDRCKQLKLPLMVQDNACQHQTNFTVSIEAAKGVTTGISAADRAHTVRVAVARGAVPEDIVQPGHIFPLRAQLGGVLVRAGHTEAGCDLARLAGFEPAAAIVEIMNDDGTMARRPDLELFAQQHQLKIGTIADLIHYRVRYEKTIEKINSGQIQTDFGEFTLHSYRDSLHGDTHFVVVKGDINADEPTLARVHVTNTVRDVLSAHNPGVQGWNINRSLQRIAEEGKGVIVLMSHIESNEEKLHSAEIVLGDAPVPTPTADGSQDVNLMVGLGSQLLRDVGIGKMRLMGQPIKYNAISGFDLEVVEYVSYEDKE
jgi:3,4-dihydroxy 2-butanone 4-phosphate synthase/GTP cyclohydrolase II